MTNTSIVYFIIKLFPFTKVIFNKFNWIEQFLNFGIVGSLNTLIAFATYYIFVYNNIHPQIAGIAGFVASVTNAWLLNKYWVFKHSENDNLITSAKFFIVYIANLFYGIFLTFLLYDCLHVSKYIIPVISLIISVPLNFILNKKWVFNGDRLN